MTARRYDPELAPLVASLPAVSDWSDMPRARAQLQELHQFPGTFHGSAVFAQAEVSRRANREIMEALARGLRR